VTSALVVGSGPNGLAAAIVLLQSGIEVEVHEAADWVGGGVHLKYQAALKVRTETVYQ